MSAAQAPDIDLERLGRLLRAMEAREHRRGWDRPYAGAVVWLLADTDATGALRMLRTVFAGLGPLVRTGIYAGQPILGGGLWAETAADRPGVQVSSVLRRLAVNLAYGTGRELTQLRELFSVPGLMGFALSYEVWTPPPGMRPRAAMVADTFTDLSGWTHARLVLACDAHDRVHTVHRLRGARPVLRLDAPIRGDVSGSLRILTDAVFGRTPPLEQFGERYPSLLDAVDRELLRRDAPVTPADLLSSG